ASKSKLACTIGDCVGSRYPGPERDIVDEYSRTLVLEVGEGRPGSEDVAQQISANDLLMGSNGSLRKRPNNTNAHVVDPDIYPAVKVASGHFRQLGDGGGIGDIGGHGQGAGSQSFALLNDFFQYLFPAGGKNQIGFFMGKGEGGCAPNATRSTGYDYRRPG